MGLVNSGIPKDIVLQLAELSGAAVFVETGTFQGATTRWAAEVFDCVHTIELSRNLYDSYHAELDALPGVQAHFGDSATVLPQIVENMDERPGLFWLDGHWSCGETAGEQQECPILAELQTLRSRPQDLILIDDARFFLCAPPRPHNPAHWPTLVEIIDVFRDSPRFIQVIDDVIFIIPKDLPLQEALVEYAQENAAQAALRSKGTHFKKFTEKLLGK